MSQSFWAKTKRRAVAILAAGAAGAAAAYCAYTWYNYNNSYSSRSDEEELDRPSTSSESHPSISPLLINPNASPTTQNLDAEAHLSHHFESIQQIAEATTLPSLLPALSRALSTADEIDNLLEKLRLSKQGGGLSAEEKAVVWQELSVAGFGRLIASIFALPLLSLQVRVCLNILGRHLYLETALAGQEEERKTESSGIFGHSSGNGLSTPPRLSAPSQEAFLSYSEYLTKTGHTSLLACGRRAAEAALVNTRLDLQLTPAVLSTLLSNALSVFVADASSLGWDCFLLPNPAALRESLRLKRPDDRALMIGGETLLVDVEAVETMVREVGFILGSERFHEIAVLCAKQVSKRVAEDLAAKITIQGGGPDVSTSTQDTTTMNPSPSLPLVRVVPLMIGEAKEVLNPRGEAMEMVKSVAEVEKLCATVYSSGPPL